jgi:predicted cupin superfamily sugar epimerase
MGDPVEMVQLHPDGKVEMFKMGNDILNGYRHQVLVPKNIWQGSRLLPGGRFALMGTTMSPGFEYTDYETGKRERLIQEYPDHRKIIVDLTTP